MSAQTHETVGGPVAEAHPPSNGIMRYALLGNPNTGKTTLFNRLCGIRAKTANFPGSTVEARIGTSPGSKTPAPGSKSSRERENTTFEIVDLPGHYGLNLPRPESAVCKKYLAGEIERTPRPDAVLVVADATNLARNLYLVSQAVQQGLPAVVALNMTDIARRRGLSIDAHKLAEHIGCPVVSVSARTGEGVDELLTVMRKPEKSWVNLPDPNDAQAAAEWAEKIIPQCVGGDHAVGESSDTFTDRLDAAFTHPILGLLVFAAVMSGLFYVIFTLAGVPMDLIDLAFAHVGDWLAAMLPAGPVNDLLVNGVVAGIAGTVVFLPQIVLLFFLLSLLEDTGYLARAAFVMDRLLRRFGLPGQAFVPMLSAHACAIPAIMSARLIPNHNDRLASIFVIPFLSCSARVPVYVLMIGMLFGERPLIAGLAFTGCYILGAVAALLTALLFRKTILRGPSTPMLLELPTYKVPSLRTAFLTTYDRAMVFLKKAGTVIVAICVVLWWLGEYPHSAPPAESVSLRAQAVELEAQDAEQAAELNDRADRLESKNHKRNSFIGRIGHTMEPVFVPLGYDWQLSVGVLSSLLAREVFVSTMAVVVTGSEDDAEDEALRERIITAERSDGRPLFTTATAASLLVYYVLAMQCLPTLAVTRRETGSWKWAAGQLIYMTGLAYILAMAVYHVLKWSGIN